MASCRVESLFCCRTNRRNIWVGINTHKLVDQLNSQNLFIIDCIMKLQTQYEKCRCLAPEYFTHGVIDEKTDVFAFGVFLLEIVSGRKPVDEAHKSLLSWVTLSPLLY